MTHPATMSESKNARTTAFKTPVIGVDFLVVAIFCASFFSPSPVVVVVVAKAFTIPDARAVLDKEWTNFFNKPAYDLSMVRSKKAVQAEAIKKN